MFKLYKYFHCKEHADNFINGCIRVTTLQECRNHETKNPRHDKGEAKHSYKPGKITADGNNPSLQNRTKQLGIKVSETATNVTIENCMKKSKIHDAYLLCMSNKNDLDKFGEHCVEIRNIDTFFSELTKLIVSEDGGCNKKGLVQYANRNYSEDQTSPGTIGFVKPVSFKKEEEYRFLWIPKSNENLEPIFVELKEAQKFLTYFNN